MTEEEAKTKWCSYALANNGSGAATNRVYLSPEVRASAASVPRADCLCLASGCMHWVPQEVTKDGELEIISGGLCGRSG